MSHLSTLSSVCFILVGLNVVWQEVMTMLTDSTMRSDLYLNYKSEFSLISERRGQNTGKDKATLINSLEVNKLKRLQPNIGHISAESISVQRT